MQVDPEYLRQYYDSLSDEALLAINRSDLVEIAQKCYDAELERRELAPQRSARRPEGLRPIPSRPDGLSSEETEEAVEPGDEGERPKWLDEAAEVYSRAVVLGTASVPARDMEDACDVLEAVGIPCYLELSEITEEKNPLPPMTHQWRLMVPGNLNLQATSILERDIFNQEFEAEWRAHLEALSDDELSAMSPEAAFCGLFDRVERVTKAFNEEIARRRLKVEST